MHIRGQSDVLAELGGAHWGLLPALLFLPWLASSRFSGAGAQAWFAWLAILIASYDLASRRIPNPLTAITALAGLAWGLAQGGLPGLGQALLGAATAFALMAVFYFLGAVGAGDVKALGALGAFLGPWGAVELFILTTLAGGLLAIIRLLWAGQGLGAGASLFSLRLLKSGLTMPYGLAICAAALYLGCVGGVK